MMVTRYPRQMLIGVSVAAVFALNGCTSSSIVRAPAAATTDMATAREGVAALRDTSAGATVRVHEHGYWVAGRSQPLQRAPETPSCELTIYEADPVTLTEFANKLSRICAMPVRVSSDALQNAKSSPAQGADEPVSRVILVGKSDSGVEKTPVEPRFDLHWKGPLAGLLDSVSRQLGLHWQLRDGAVEIFRTETRTFQVYALPVTDALSSSVTANTSSSLGAGGGGSSGGGNGGAGGGQGGFNGSGGSAQSVATTLKSSVMDDISKTVSAMLTPKQGKMTLSMATASLTVTDDPDVLDRIARYLDQQNKLLTTQVVLNVKILNVAFDREDQYGIDWNLAYNTAPFGGGLSNATDVAGSIVSFRVLRGPFKDSSLFIKALSKQGKVSVVTQPSVTTMNLQAVPMQVAQQTAYVASVTNTAVAQVGALGGIEPGTITTGFNMMLLPYVMPDNQVLLQYNISLSDLTEIADFGTEKTGKVQLPTVSLRAFAQKVRLRSGETLALSGFEQNQNMSKRSGVGSPDNPLLGGVRSGRVQHSVIVILITPVVVR